MRVVIIFTALICAASVLRAQTETAATTSRDYHARRADVEPLTLPPRPLSPPVAASAVVPLRVPPRVVSETIPTRVVPPVSVATAPAVATIAQLPIVPTATRNWLDVMPTIRYGYYDDGFVDDNWFYDYYELPSAVALERPTSAAPGYRTSWRYDPAVEQRLFRW